MHKLVITGIILLTIPAYGQDGRGDLNCNGYCYEISDLVLGLLIIGERCGTDYFEQCTIDNGDIDDDGIPLTIADAMQILYIINSSDPPDFSRHPESDTIMTGSADAAPGDVLEIPLIMKTVDTVTALQFTIMTDPDLITIDTLIFMYSFMPIFSFCDGFIYACDFSREIWEGADFSFLPGEYHIADIVIAVSPDISEPVTTAVEFLNDPEAIHNTGFSNLSYIVPAVVNGEIRITSTGIENGESGIVPRNISIDVHPNPFNGSTNVTVRSSCQTDLVICDIMGRVVRRIPVYQGLNQFGWDATDDNGASLASGVFFARLENAPAKYSKKIIFLK